MQLFLPDESDPTPLFAQLDRAIRAAIVVGSLGPGDKLPTVRVLAADVGLSPNTVAKVYGELRRAGVLVTRRSAGTFVSDAPIASGASTRRDRERGLQSLVDRLLADALMIGVSLPEIVHHLQSRESRRLKEKD
jgi:GntR family transcriptional regulator